MVSLTGIITAINTDEEKVFARGERERERERERGGEGIVGVYIYDNREEGNNGEMERKARGRKEWREGMNM